MKKLIRLLILAMTLLTTSTVFALSIDETNAQNVLERYYNALTAGDTATLKSLLTGYLLEKRMRLLDNPTYPAYLTKTYGNTHLIINQINTITPSDITIDASIINDNDQEEISRRKYLLRKEMKSSATTSGFYIYDETNPDIQ